MPGYSSAPDDVASRQAPKLLIFPRNGNGVEALDCLGEAWRFAGFVDDTHEKQGVDAFGHRVFGRSALADLTDVQFLAVPGAARSYRSRKAVIEGLGVTADRFARVIHPTARVSPLAGIGHNVLIMAGVVITSNAVIGNHVCILPNSVIHHDVTIGDWTLIGANVTIAGHTAVGRNCYVGSGSSIMNGLRLGERCLVGLGSNIIRSVAADATVVGNPGREI
jgi:sugar O-acyltransferase (sialic acid O-acetyltransferase NeuD family)